jgi:hypothetical protein
MVLTRTELLASLNNEVRILLHLAGKLTPADLDYRPTPKQRSAMELLKYLTMMGPALLEAAKTGTFNVEAWTRAEKAAESHDFDHVLAAIAAHPGFYETLLADMTDEQFREEVQMFGMTTTRGSFIVNQVLCGCAAYRTQLFLYLKACGHADLGTMNLWAGMDAPAKS